MSIRQGQSRVPNQSSIEAVRLFYRALLQAWGPQHWWPAESAFEVIVGAFLTQNTAWSNVERAISNMRAAGVLSVEAVRRIPNEQLEQLVRPSGYFRQKAQRLKDFISFLDTRYAGSLDRMFAALTEKLRAELLSLKGVGPETADSILLYAGNQPSFVVDAYTRRIFERHGIIAANSSYDEIRYLVECSLAGEIEPIASLGDEVVGGGSCHAPSSMSKAIRSATAQAYNEMHALIVGVGKKHCLKAAAKCEGCPLARFLPAGNIEKCRKAPTS
ncbi:MAG TPA: base excision DNA repair protein [Terriglobales bacterium]|nr:base excision DNA repair protein [Terriglobales bacterium]